MNYEFITHDRNDFAIALNKFWNESKNYVEKINKNLIQEIYKNNRKEARKLLTENYLKYHVNDNLLSILACQKKWKMLFLLLEDYDITDVKECFRFASENGYIFFIKHLIKIYSHRIKPAYIEQGIELATKNNFTEMVKFLKSIDFKKEGIYCEN